MKNAQRIVSIVAMAAIAGGSGFYMQQKHGNGASSQGPVPNEITPTSANPQGLDAPAQIAGPSLTLAPEPQPDLRLAAAGSATSVSPPVAVEVALTTPTVAETPEPTAAPSCTTDMALIAQPGAMLDIGLLAPCHQNQRIVLRHAGLVITGQTSSAGSFIASIPALASPAQVQISFVGGGETTQSVPVPDLTNFDRFGVQWMANDAFQVHAYHKGAGFGDPGHVSAAATGRVSAEGGFLTLIGDDRAERPLLAEIYTYPATLRAKDKDVIVSVEAAVTEGTCGREILGETIQLSQGNLTIRDLTISMPGCDSVGEFMVLDQPVLLANK